MVHVPAGEVEHQVMIASSSTISSSIDSKSPTPNTKNSLMPAVTRIPSIGNSLSLKTAEPSRSAKLWSISVIKPTGRDPLHGSSVILPLAKKNFPSAA